LLVQAPERNREMFWGNSKFPFWVFGSGLFSEVYEVCNMTERGSAWRRSKPAFFPLLFAFMEPRKLAPYT
jgi:hypothetical protein